MDGCCRRRRNRPMWFSVFFICIIGSSYGFHMVLTRYYKFEDTTSVNVEFKKYTDSVALTLALPLKDMIDYARFNRDHKSDAYKGNVYDRMNVDQMLKYSPSVADAVKGCRIWRTSKDTIIAVLKAKECIDTYVKVRRFIMNGKLCYRWWFGQRAKGGLWDHMIQYDATHPNVVHSIIFDLKVLQKAGKYLIFHSMVKNPPYKAIGKAVAGFYRQGYHRIGARYQNMSSDNLENPYPTNCEHMVVAQKISECIENHLKELGRLPLSSLYREGMTGYLVSDTFLAQADNREQFLNITDTCNGKYAHIIECEDENFLTSIEEEFWNGEEFIIDSLMPIHPSLTVVRSPKLVFIDMLILIANILGFWFGFSCLGVNPFKMDGSLYDFCPCEWCEENGPQSDNGPAPTTNQREEEEEETQMDDRYSSDEHEDEPYGRRHGALYISKVRY